MSRINSSKGRIKTNSSNISNKTSPELSKKDNTRKFDQDMPLIENFSSTESANNIEQALINFYEYSIDSYKKKLYDNLLKEIEMNKNLLYMGTKESFNIFIIEIKCLMKLMVEKYENDLNEINDEQMSVKEYINVIQKEFFKINTIIKRDDYSQFETITQIYCKFLIYLIKFSQKKEEYYKSLGFITLGINMIKIFFIRKKVTKNLKLYKRYVYFLVLLINHLIGEGNFTQALLYSGNTLKIIETAVKILYIRDNDYNQHKKNKNLIEFIRCSGFICIYVGICHELKKNPEMAMEAYKQAFYFFVKLKSHEFHGIKLNEDKIFFDNNFVKLSHWLLNKIRFKIEGEKRRRYKIRMSLFLKGIYEKKEENIEKSKKLKLISSGLNENQKRYNFIENNLYTTVLNSKNNKLIEKLDNALINLAFKDNKNSRNTSKKKLSYNTMGTLCHYQIYNKLMTQKYQEFIMTNNNIKLSNPKDEEDFIHKVNSYLTQNMEIKPQTARKNKSLKLKIDKNSNKNLNKNSNNNLNKNSLSSPNLNNNKGFSTTVNSSTKISRKVLSKLELLSDKEILCNNKSSKKLSFQKKFNFSSLKLDIDIPSFSNNLYNHPIAKSFSETYLNSKTINLKSIKLQQKAKIKNNLNSNWSKSIYLNPKYYKRYINLDKLIKKELNFQKDILNIKSNNCKLYHNSFAKEIFITGKDREEERNKDYMILTEKIDQKVLSNQKEYEKLIYFIIKKKQESNNNRYKLKNNNNDILDDELFGINKKLDLEGSDEEEKDFNEINQNSLLSVNEKLRNIIYKISERKNLLKRLKKKGEI